MDEQLSFIETQFPVSKVSKESYKERKAVQSQTLTGIGKWWGRKPLILVRAAIIAALMPVSENPQKDTDVFLRILSMDHDGLKDRKSKRISPAEMYEYASINNKFRKYLDEWFVVENNKVKISDDVDKQQIENRIFESLGYDDKLKYCLRPEELKNISRKEWEIINSHLGTSAQSLQELTRQLSEKRFERNVTVGDCFCGGGSIPFEAARIGTNVIASDLNPVAGELTWADLAFSKLDKNHKKKLHQFQEKVYHYVDKQILELGVETAENGDRADAYLYCTEVKCPECGATVPVIPNCLIGQGSRTVAILEPEDKRVRIRIKMGASKDELAIAKSSGTISNNEIFCPCCGKKTPVSAIRKDRVDESGNNVNGLRKWEKNEFKYRDTDIYHERLYVIRYTDSDGNRYYQEPDDHDLKNEKKVNDFVEAHIEEWQRQGIIPDSEIQSGYKTDEPLRERGWKYWHQLFSARQLLTLALMQMGIIKNAQTDNELIYGLLCLHRCCDWNSKLCRWGVGQARESMAQTFYNQAFNTMWNYGNRGLSLLKGVFFLNIDSLLEKIPGDTKVILSDARDLDENADIWITDPPYADAVNYHELSEFFLAWDKPITNRVFNNWYTDSKRILAVKGDAHFSDTMIDIYSNLTRHMPDNGIQIVMFTHSDPAVWAQLAIIMWRSGLHVTAAWNIATETDRSGFAEGNYVKGTVLLVLRKQTGSDIAFLDEINADIREEVKRQISSMQQLDDKEEPNFSDPDYVLAAYAASLKVLTSYKEIEDLDLDYELNQAISDPSNSKVVAIIENAKKIAYDCVIPTDFDNYFWRELTNAEKFYIKGLESEKHGNYQIGTYQEFARGFSIGGYSQLMASERANSARLKTPYEMGDRSLNDVPDFQNSLMRTVFEGIYVAINNDMNPSKGLDFIKNDIPNYWDKREMIQQILSFLVDINDISNMQEHWADSAKMADALLTVVKHDSI